MNNINFQNLNNRFKASNYKIKDLEKKENDFNFCKRALGELLSTEKSSVEFMRSLGVFVAESPNLETEFYKIFIGILRKIEICGDLYGSFKDFKKNHGQFDLRATTLLKKKMTELYKI